MLTDNDNDFKRIGELDFSQTYGFINTMFVSNNILFVHLNTGYYWQLRRYSKMKLLAVTYCQIDKIVAISPQTFIVGNIYGINLMTNDKNGNIVIHYDCSTDYNEDNEPNK